MTNDEIDAINEHIAHAQRELSAAATAFRANFDSSPNNFRLVSAICQDISDRIRHRLEEDAARLIAGDLNSEIIL